MTKARQRFYGSVPRTALATTITAGSGTIVLTDATGWPTTGPFTIVLERGTTREELVSISSRSGVNLTVAASGRGYDSSTAQSHTASSSCYVEHCIDASWHDLMDSILATPTTKGDLLVSTGSIYARQAVGSDGQVVVADSAQTNGLKWSTVGTAGLTDAGVTTAKLADGGVTNAKITGPLDAQARVGFQLNSGSTFTRRRIHLTTGAGLTATAADDSGNEEVDLTLEASNRLISASYSNVALGSVSNSTTETQIGTVSLTAGQAPVGSIMRVRWGLYFVNDTTATRTVRLKVKVGANVYADTQVQNLTYIAGGAFVGFLDHEIYVVSASEHIWTSQCFVGGPSVLGRDPGMLTGIFQVLGGPWDDSLFPFDITATPTLSLTCTLGTASASLTGALYYVRVDRLTNA